VQASPQPSPTERRLPHRWFIGLAAVAVIGVAAVGGYLLGRQLDDGSADRQAEVAERGAQIMPFELDATTHVFAPTGDGGVQTVTADDPEDTQQIALVRSHLRDEAAAFRAGDFEDPAAIHGHDMPGISTLEANASSIEIAYQDVPAGGRITYRASDPAVVQALHDWFAAQLMDHGEHATGG
jgi:hypothetical protein